MVRIPNGSFTMGSRTPTLEDSFFLDARPHRVTLTKPFYMADRAIPVSLYKQCVRDGAHGLLKPRLRSPQGATCPTESCPIQQVTWQDALLFCNWLSKKENREVCYYPITTNEHGKEVETWCWNRESSGYRLPSEAEWEFACRAGTTTAYSFGNDWHQLLKYGRFLTNSDRHSWPGGRTSPPNGWGLFDMHGNMSSWCWDWYEEGYSREEKDPQGPVTGKARVVRGGSFYSPGPGDCASAMRYRAPPDRPYAHIGIRVVLSATSSR
jgi:formylglycine-generating enzyme required for sulfatase activity